MAFGAFSPNQFANGILKNVLPPMSTSNNNQPVNIQFTGDLKFDGIKSEGDATKFINQILNIAQDAR